MPKIGFAGFPNETKAYLGDKKIGGFGISWLEGLRKF